MSNSLELDHRPHTPLFVPGDRPERFAKAVAAGPSAVIIDLEDAVAPAAKGIALENVVTALKDGLGGSSCPIFVRLNRGNMQTELAALASVFGQLAGLMIPKVESAAEVDAIDCTVPLVALIETAAGVENANEIARSRRVERLAFGAFDFQANVGGSHEVLLGYARARLVLASVIAKTSRPWDSPAAEIKDIQAVTRKARSAYEMGFAGMLCIHPAQVPAVRDGYRPTREEVDWARTIMGAIDAAEQVNGQMVDAPIAMRAQEILGRALS